MRKYIYLINKLSNTDKITYEWLLDPSNKKKDVVLFFKFLENAEYATKVENIYDLLIHIFNYKIGIEFDNFLNNEEKIKLLAIFIFKSISKAHITPAVSDISYINSDIVLNTVLNFYNKFLIYYKYSYVDDEISFKKNIFKIIASLVTEDIIKEKLIRIGEKSLKQWSLELPSVILSTEEYLNISNTPFKIITVNNKKYLKGNFFTQVYKIFTENIKSGESFEFKETTDYLDRVVKTKFYINNQDLKDVISLIEDYEKIDESIIKNQINTLNSNIKENLIKISAEKTRIKNLYIYKIREKINLEYENFKSLGGNSLEDFLIKIFIDFCAKFLNLNKKINISSEQYEGFKECLKNILSEEYNKKKIKKRYKFNKIEEISNLETYDTFDNIDEINKLEFYNSFNEIPERGTNSSEYGQNFEEFIINDVQKTYEIDLIDLIDFFKTQEIKNLLKRKWKSFISIKNNYYSSTKLKKKSEDKLYSIGYKFLAEDLWKSFYTEQSKILDPLVKANKIRYGKISRLMIFYNLYLLKNYNIADDEAIYLPFSFDFRGRFYYISAISPTTMKYARYIYNYGYYSETELLSNAKNSLSTLINEHISYIESTKRKYSIKRNSIQINEAIFWTLISIGKIKIEKNKISTSTIELLNKASELLNKNSKSKLDIIDKIELMHYEKILKSFAQEKVIIRGLLKDATASFIQNLIRLMGHKNEDALKYANLNSTAYWYDSYSYILSKWKEEEEKLNKVGNGYLDLFVRKTVKKTIMTNPYSATYTTAFNYFKEAVEEQIGIEINFGSEEEKVFKRFYNFISTEVEDKYFLKNNSKKMVEYIKKLMKDSKREIIIESHDAKTNLVYYKLTPKNYDLIITIPSKQTKKRITKKYEQIDKLRIDYEKIATAIRANWIHYIDALLLRDINRASKKIYITIHDCFIVDPLNVSNFILIANQESNKRVFKNIDWELPDEKFFSIYVFI